MELSLLVETNENTKHDSLGPSNCTALLRVKMVSGSLTICLLSPWREEPRLRIKSQRKMAFRGEGGFRRTFCPMFKYALANELQVESKVHCPPNARDTLEF